MLKSLSMWGSFLYIDVRAHTADILICCTTQKHAPFF